MKNQELAFRKSEGNKWFLRNLKKLEENSIEISLLCNWLMPFQNDINNILEIGSGAGNKLAQLCWQLNASGQGVDPSKTAVDFANKKYNQKCSYTVATADNLSFFNNKFDLVHFGFCLYLVSRNKINDVIKQADQLLKSGKFLSIIDFEKFNAQIVEEYKSASKLIIEAIGRLSEKKTGKVSSNLPLINSPPLILGIVPSPG